MKKYLRTGLLFFAFFAPISSGVMAADKVSENKVANENLEKLLKTKSCKNCNLSGLTLNRLDLSDADLEGADLSSAKLLLTNLARADLRNTNLRGVDFGGSDLSDADLRGADLRGTSLDSAYYQGAKIDGKFVTEKPYEDVGVPEVEKKVYVPDAKTPKTPPETKAVSIDTGTALKKSPPQSPVAAEVKVAPISEKPDKTSGKKAESPSALPGTEAPSAKKAVPPQQAIVDSSGPKEDTNGAKMEHGPELKDPPQKPAESAVIAQSAKSSTIKPKINEENGSKQAVAAKPEQTPPPARVAKVAAPSEKEAEGSGNNNPDRSKAENLAKLLAKNGCFGCDLSGLDLSGKDLEGADLEKANLTGSNLENADLAKANLKGALLVKAVLRKANLKNADLYKADLTAADFTGAKLTGVMIDSAETASTIGLKEAMKNAEE